MKAKQRLPLLFTCFMLVAGGLSSCVTPQTPPPSTSTPVITSTPAVPVPSVGYSIIDWQKEYWGKCLVDVRITNLITLGQIKEIADYIHAHDLPACNRLYIYYFQPGQRPGTDVAWAYSNPDDPAHINGIDISTKATLDANAAKSKSDSNVVGIWLDTWGISRTIIIRKVNGKYEMTSTFADGSGDTIPLTVKVVNGNERLVGELGVSYMLIEADGSLGFYDGKGLIYKAISK